ncbi:AEX-3 domain-containing protein [Entophlyctis helioformis]|nr:AEX-3 domain-containing protein [Entophlyctis helioformis]
MFCFPNDLTLVYNETSTPPDTFHTFISTDQAGVRSYGTCVTVYEKPKGELYRQLESAITKWGQANLSESDFEYFNHVNDQLVAHQAKLQKARLDPSAEPFEISMYEEKVALYEELLAPLKVTVVVKPEHIYVPRSIGVTSHWPWYALLKDWLCELVRQMRNPSQRGLYYAPLERCVINLLHEIPLPPPGKLEISINIGNVQLHCARPPVNTISILKNFSMYPLFRSMSVHHIVMIFELLLMEHKVIFVSSHYSMLNAAAETMINLIYPFYWHHLIVPILPARLMKCLDVPMPYIMGVHRKYFTQAVQAELRPPDAAVVDIDNDTIDNEEAFVGIPGRERRKLVSRIEKYIPVFLPPQASGLSRSGTGNALSSMAYAGGNPAASAASKGLPRLSENSSTSSPAGAPPLPTPATTSNGFSNLLSRRMSTPAPPNLPDGITDVRNTRGVPLTMQAAFPRGRAVFTTADSHIGARKVHDIPKSMYTKYAKSFSRPRRRCRANPSRPNTRWSALQDRPTTTRSCCTACRRALITCIGPHARRRLGQYPRQHRLCPCGCRRDRRLDR